MKFCIDCVKGGHSLEIAILSKKILIFKTDVAELLKSFSMKFHLCPMYSFCVIDYFRPTGDAQDCGAAMCRRRMPQCLPTSH